MADHKVNDIVAGGSIVPSPSLQAADCTRAPVEEQDAVKKNRSGLMSVDQENCPQGRGESAPAKGNKNKKAVGTVKRTSNNNIRSVLQVLFEK